jgi:hypothetical protein
MKYKKDWPPAGTVRPYELYILLISEKYDDHWYYYGRFKTREGAKQSFRTIDRSIERKYFEVSPMFKIIDSRDRSVSFIEEE